MNGLRIFCLSSAIPRVYPRERVCRARTEIVNNIALTAPKRYFLHCMSLIKGGYWCVDMGI
jgi:hypothetical protein